MCQDSDRYRLLIGDMPDAFAYHRIITDNQGNPVDFEFIDINNAFEEMTGLKKDHLIGKKVTELLPGIRESNFDWIDAYGKVALTGESTSFEEYVKPLNRWYEITANINKSGYFVTLFRDITNRKKVEEALRISEKYNRLIVDVIPDIIFKISKMGDYMDVITSSESKLYLPKEEIIGKNLINILPEKIAYLAVEYIKKALETKTLQMFEYDLTVPAGDLWFEARIMPSGEEEVITLIRDITERKQAEDALRRSEEYNRLIIEVIPDIIIRTNKKGVYLDIIASSNDKLFRPKEELLGEKMSDYLHKNDGFRFNQCLKKALETGSLQVLEYKLNIPAGNFWFEARILPSGENEVITLIRDITQRKQTEEKIRKLTFHDSLTGLYNRAYLEQEMQRLDTKRQLPISLIMADLNGLKMINDTYGHGVGDEMLIKAAEIFKQSCRKEDIIARWSGDEFIIFLPQTTIKEAGIICKRIVDGCRKILIKTVPFSMALGAASKTDIEKDLSETLKEAERNMYKHKLAESRSTKNAVLNALLKTLEEKSYETEEHARRMQEIALKIAGKIDLPKTELDRLTLLVYLHDIGKITVPEEVLTKKQKLTQQDWEHIKKHPETGYRIARSMEEFAHIAEDILYHHEHWNGSGYPKGLRWKEIPLLARIVNIVDAYEVMVNGRPYKAPLSQQEASDELKRCAGTQFDPELVDIFLSILKK